MMRWVLLCAVLAACDATSSRAAVAASSVTTRPATSTPIAPPPDASAPGPARDFALAAHAPWREIGSAPGAPAFLPDGHAIGLHGKRGLVVVDAATLAARPFPHAAPVSTSAGPLLVFPGAAYVVASGAEVVLPKRSGYASCWTSFSNDGRFAGRECASSDAYPCGATPSNLAFDVIDVATGAVLHHFDHPRDCDMAFLEDTHGSLTASGRFVKWTTRETATFEDLRAPGPGYPVTSDSELSPDDTLLFTTLDRYSRGLHQVWVTGPSPAKMVDPRNGRTRFDLPNDVKEVVFSPSGKLFAAVHARLAPPWTIEPRSVTVHASTGAAPLLTVPLAGEEPTVAFSADDRAIAVATASELRVYSR